MGIWNNLFGKKDVVSKTLRPSDELKERREWLFFAILTYLRNEVFKKIKREFSIDDITFESKYDVIYPEMMSALLTLGLVNIKEHVSEDDFDDITMYYIDLIRVFGMKLQTKELMDADQIIDVFSIYVSWMGNYDDFVDIFVERMSNLLSLDQDIFKQFSTLSLIGMGLAYGRDAFYSVSIDDIQKNNHEMRQHLLRSSGAFGKNLIKFLDA